MSSYNFKMGEAKGAAWIQGVLKTEKQMMDEQRLTGDFDTVAGASNSIQQSMVPLAAELAPQTEKPSKAKFYSIAEDLGKGITGRLKVLLKMEKLSLADMMKYLQILQKISNFLDKNNTTDNQNMKV